MGQRALGARIRAKVAQTPLQSQDLMEPLHVAARQRQGPKARDGRSLFSRQLSRESERDEEAAEKDGVREALRHRVVLSPVGVERGERLPEAIASRVVQFR